MCSVFINPIHVVDVHQYRFSSHCGRIGGRSAPIKRTYQTRDGSVRPKNERCETKSIGRKPKRPKRIGGAPTYPFRQAFVRTSRASVLNGDRTLARSAAHVRRGVRRRSPCARCLLVGTRRRVLGADDRYGRRHA